MIPSGLLLISHIYPMVIPSVSIFFVTNFPNFSTFFHDRLHPAMGPGAAMAQDLQKQMGVSPPVNLSRASRSSRSSRTSRSSNQSCSDDGSREAPKSPPKTPPKSPARSRSGENDTSRLAGDGTGVMWNWWAGDWLINIDSWNFVENGWEWRISRWLAME